MHSRSRSFLLALPALAIACDRAEQASNPYVVRDSAEITIVENFEPVWKQGDEWRVAGIIVDINASKGAAYDLVNANSSVRLPNGTIVVAVSGAHEIRWYDVDGVHLRTVEEHADWVGRLGDDSLAAWHSAQTSMSVYSVRGEYGRALQIGLPTDDVPTSVQTLRDGSLLASGAVLDNAATQYHLSPEGALLHVLGSYSGSVAVASAGLYARPLDTSGVGLFDLTGNLRTIVRHPGHDDASQHGALVVDLEDNLWVEDRHAGDDAIPSWSVFDTSQRLLGTVLMPRNFTPHLIGNFVLGRFVDFDGVEHIRLYALSKPG